LAEKMAITINFSDRNPSIYKLQYNLNKYSRWKMFREPKRGVSAKSIWIIDRKAGKYLLCGVVSVGKWRTAV